MFDHLYAVAEGKCIFSGATNSLIPFLRDLDLICPESYNPTDYRKYDLFPFHLLSIRAVLFFL